MFYGVGNSSRGKSALPLFIEYLQSIDPSYNMEFEWQQPKNNKIFDQLTADSLKADRHFRHDPDPGRQPDRDPRWYRPAYWTPIIPKEWAEANGTTADAVRRLSCPTDH